MGGEEYFYKEVECEGVDMLFTILLLKCRSYIIWNTGLENPKFPASQEITVFTTAWCLSFS